MLTLEQQWAGHFAERAGQHRSVHIDPVVDMNDEDRRVLGRSLATFHIGESGTGEHVLGAAQASGVDPAYLDALQAFLDEEHEHARLLALILDAIGHPPLTDHWTDRAFIFIRRMSSIRTQVLTLLVAELVAVPYYLAMHEGIGSPELAGVFRRIHADEVGHVDFHAETLPPQMRRWPQPLRWAVGLVWSSLVTTTSVIVAIDHRQALRRLGRGPRRFVADVWRLRRDVARRLFA